MGFVREVQAIEPAAEDHEEDGEDEGDGDADALAQVAIGFGDLLLPLA